jgi:iron complex transport system substrate-binding protein
MMRKKHLFALVFTMVVSLGLTACGTGQTPNSSTTPSSESTQNQESVPQDDSGNQENQISETADSTSPEADQESQTLDTVTITSLNGNREMFELEVPYNPERIAILDMASMDILDNLGVGDRIVGSASTSLDYLQQYVTNDNVANLGTIKEADMEAVMACEPDIIFIGGRLSKSYDDLSEIAPVVYLATDTEKGVVESVGTNARTIASIFGLEDQVDDKIAGFEDRIAALRSFAEGKNAIVGLVTSGGLNVLGNDGRCSVIGREIGFENIGVDANIDTSTHGNEASFEFIVEKNPQYLFIMDRDAAIQSEGAKLAQEIVENELVMGTDVYKNGNIIYLAHPAVWYTAEGGITALDLMLQDLETELLDGSFDKTISET